MSSTPKFTFTATVTPDMCGREPFMLPTTVFTLFQNAASLHAEDIGNGTAALAERDLYWVATHTRIDFHARAQLMDNIAVTTWPAWSKPNAVRGYRGYDIRCGGKLVAEGLTEWVVLNRHAGFVRFSEFGFPEDFEFCNELPFDGRLGRHRDEFDENDEVYTFVVRTSSIDIGHHMNNVAYVRAFLDCFGTEELANMPIKSVEVRYVTACMEGEELRIYRKAVDGGYLLGARRADGKCAAIAGITLEK